MQVAPLGPVGLVGRRPELAAISAAAQASANYQPSVLWIEGDAGLGKTSLLRHALRNLPEDFTVVTAEADEFASDVSFNLLEQLGVRQATAVFPAGLELLEYLGRLQSAGPVAVVVEDLHWADPESRAALLVAARRLGQDRVLMVVTSRPKAAPDDGWERFRFDPSRCLVIRMTRLSLAEVAEMAHTSGVSLSPAAADRLHRHTGGHPLYARTLLSEFSAAQLTSSDGSLPVPRSLASATVARLAELPQGARDLAAALAVLNHGAPLQVVARVGGVAEPSRALDSLVSTGFVAWQAGDGQGLLDFSHPIFRAAVYSDLAPSRRQELHRAAAEVTGAQALAHRVAAADTADDALALEVEALAVDEARGHHFGSAAAHLLSASRLSSVPQQARGAAPARRPAATGGRPNRSSQYPPAAARRMPAWAGAQPGAGDNGLGPRRARIGRKAPGRSGRLRGHKAAQRRSGRTDRDGRRRIGTALSGLRGPSESRRSRGRGRCRPCLRAGRTECRTDGHNVSGVWRGHVVRCSGRARAFVRPSACRSRAGRAR